METMILVAGLAVAGLAGIAAAFYFSMRPGGSGLRGARSSGRRGPANRARAADRVRVRPADRAPAADRDRADRVPAGGSRTSPRPVRSDRTASSTVIDFTGPQPVLQEPEPLVPGRRARHEDPAPMSRSRRRGGWRKGSDVEEEMWPAEGFGGVSDEQFWDDLAADKPLATTARTAQPETAAQRR